MAATSLGLLLAPALCRTYALGKDQFLLDGQPTRMLSGELLYLRIPREA